MCCLFGLIDYKDCLSIRQKERIIKILSTECEARGTDATGIAYIENNRMNIYKKPLPAHKMKYRFKSNPKIIMGHTRMTTQGSEKINHNNHPFYSEKLGFALAHNGILHNDKLLRKSENLPSTNIETDSYIAVQLIDNQETLNFETIANMAEKVEGSFCFTILSPNNELYIIKGDNPMAIAHFNGFYIYASTAEILSKALKKLMFKAFENVKIKSGDILKFDKYGSILESSFKFAENLSYYDYCFSRNKGIKHTYQDSLDDSYLDYLIQYASFVGYDEETILELLNNGFDYMDIEEMLYDTEMTNECYYSEQTTLDKI